MEHYHKLKSLKSVNDYLEKRSKLFSMKSIDSQTKADIDLKNQNDLKDLRNIQKVGKQKEMKSSQIIEQLSKEHTQQDFSFSFQSRNSQDQNRRNFIYDNQSYKETGDELNQSTVESNNQIFQMVFLSKPKFKESVQTAASFTKIKCSEKEQNNLNIYQFNIGKKLGSGKFGQVFIAKHIKTGFLFALKRIDKNNINQKLLIQLIRQIKIQTYLNHPNIVKLYTFFSDERYIYLIMQLCYSGQLYGFLKKKRRLPEDLTKMILKDTLKALDYMHERQIIHRDLKPQNIIFHNVNIYISKGMIKLCDFGWSISSKTMRQTFCGTPLYVSPQLLKRKNYNNKIDVWSVGILTYQLLFGRVPFDISTERDFIKIVEEEIKFSRATKISNEAKDFILICLKKDPRDRYTVPELLQHPFITSLQVVQTSQMF